MTKDQAIPDAGLEDIPIYENIMKSAIMKVSTHPELFQCAEVIDRILPRSYIPKMILSNINGQGFVSYILTYVSQACKLPTPQIYLIEKCIKGLDLDVFDCVRKIIVHGKQFCAKPSG